RLHPVPHLQLVVPGGEHPREAPGVHAAARPRPLRRAVRRDRCAGLPGVRPGPPSRRARARLDDARPPRSRVPPMSEAAAKAFELYKADVGNDEGTGEWFEVTQEQVNQFADLTHDHQFIHVDPERAKDTPFGGTIAHGFLTLSMLTHLSKGASSA